MPGISFDDGHAYEQFMGRWSRKVGSIFLNWLSPPRGATWLDVGCGTGAFTQLVLERCEPEAVTAIDRSAAQLQSARTNLTRFNVELVQFDAAQIASLPRTFDAVVSALVLNFLDAPRDAVAQMRKVAQPGGLVAGFVWDFQAEMAPSSPLAIGLRSIGVDTPEVPGKDIANTDLLCALHADAGLDRVQATVIDIEVQFDSFDLFWKAMTPSFSPATSVIASLTVADLNSLREIVRQLLRAEADGAVAYPARALAFRGQVPV